MGMPKVVGCSGHAIVTGSSRRCSKRNISCTTSRHRSEFLRQKDVSHREVEMKVQRFVIVVDRLLKVNRLSEREMPQLTTLKEARQFVKDAVSCEEFHIQTTYLDYPNNTSNAYDIADQIEQSLFKSKG